MPAKVRPVLIDSLAPHPANPREGNIPAIRESIRVNGWHGSVLAQESTRLIVVGRHRWEAAKLEGFKRIPCELRPMSDAEALRLIAVDNRTSDLAGYNDALLGSLLSELRDSPLGLEGSGYDDAALDALLAEHIDPGGDAPGSRAGSLAARFIVPPFSVLDARQGYWQDRKRAWLSLGIRSEEGRARNLLKMSDTVLAAQQPNGSKAAPRGAADPAWEWKKQEAERAAGRELSAAEFEADWYEADAYVGGTSIFDPVLCELAYRWWCPPKGSVLDPFAGGSVRGVVAATLGLAYDGVDLRAEQCEANREQAEELGLGSLARWHEGDALDAQPPGPFDFVFSCPPYFDLEKYSDDKRDLSNAGDFDRFLGSYRQIIAEAVARLAPDRFACFVVGEIRDGDGLLRGFVPETIAAFELAGATFYNEAILVTAVGSLAIRAARIFTGGRKLAKGHQNVLVFCKGNPAKAAAALGELELPDPAELFGYALGPDFAADL